MKRTVLTLGAVLCLTTSTAEAAGIIGTSRSFSTSPFCVQYKCTLTTRTGNAWLYKTKFGDFVLVSRTSADPSSKIVSTGLFINSPSLNYLTEDRRTFSALQLESLGGAKVALRESCYESSADLQDLGRLTVAGRKGGVTCGLLEPGDGTSTLVIVISSLN